MRCSLPTLLFATALTGACATTTTTTTTTTSSSDADADSLKDQKDRTACLKMCEMAGAAEDKSDEVAACQAQCPAAADSAPAP